MGLKTLKHHVFRAFKHEAFGANTVSHARKSEIFKVEKNDTADLIMER